MKAKFNRKTKEAILKRDLGCCIICWGREILQFHHCRYWLEARRIKDRNNVNQGVTVCLDCHVLAHGCKSGEWIRQECIDYLGIINNKYLWKKNI